MKGLPIHHSSLCFSFLFTVLLCSILFVLPAAKASPTSLAVCIAPSLTVCFCARGPTRQVKQRQMKLSCLSATLEGINHDSVSALMRLPRCLFEIEPSGALDHSPLWQHLQAHGGSQVLIRPVWAPVQPSGHYSGHEKTTLKLNNHPKHRKCE